MELEYDKPRLDERGEFIPDSLPKKAWPGTRSRYVRKNLVEQRKGMLEIADIWAGRLKELQLPEGVKGVAVVRFDFFGGFKLRRWYNPLSQQYPIVKIAVPQVRIGTNCGRSSIHTHYPDFCQVYFEGEPAQQIAEGSWPEVKSTLERVLGGSWHLSDNLPHFPKPL